MKVVYDAEKTLTDAVEHAAQQCKFEQVVKLITAAVVIYQTGSVFAGELVDAIGELAKGGPENEEFSAILKRWGKVLEPPKQAYDDLVKAWANLPTIDDTTGMPVEFIGLNQNEGYKEIREKLDKIVAGIGTDEAYAYSEQVIRYLNLVQARNVAIFRRDQIKVSLKQIQARLEDSKMQQKGLKQTLAEGYDPNIPDNVMRIEEFLQSGIKNATRVY